MNYPKTKHEITQRVLTEIPNSVWSDLPIEKIIYAWWWTGRAGSGLRLTEAGMNAFLLAEISHYDIVAGTPIKKGKWLSDNDLHLTSKYIKCPYWIGAGESKDSYIIRLYDHAIATLVSLQGGLMDYILYKQNLSRT